MVTNTVDASSSRVPQAHPVDTTTGLTDLPMILAISAPVALAQSGGPGWGLAAEGVPAAAGLARRSTPDVNAVGSTLRNSTNMPTMTKPEPSRTREPNTPRPLDRRGAGR